MLRRAATNAWAIVWVPAPAPGSARSPVPPPIEAGTKMSLVSPRVSPAAVTSSMAACPARAARWATPPVSRARDRDDGAGAWCVVEGVGAGGGEVEVAEAPVGQPGARGEDLDLPVEVAGRPRGRRRRDRERRGQRAGDARPGEQRVGVDQRVAQRPPDGLLDHEVPGQVVDGGRVVVGQRRDRGQRGGARRARIEQDGLAHEVGTVGRQVGVAERRPPAGRQPRPPPAGCRRPPGRSSR